MAKEITKVYSKQYPEYGFDYAGKIDKKNKENYMLSKWHPVLMHLIQKVDPTIVDSWAIIKDYCKLKGIQWDDRFKNLENGTPVAPAQAHQDNPLEQYKEHYSQRLAQARARGINPTPEQIQAQIQSEGVAPNMIAPLMAHLCPQTIPTNTNSF